MWTELLQTRGYSAWRFVAFNALGAVLWARTVDGIGWVFGAAAEKALGRMHAIEGQVLAALVGMLLATALVRAVLHRRVGRARRAGRADMREP
jgi:membrane protein DedA with SNARE-associated domain